VRQSCGCPQGTQRRWKKKKKRVGGAPSRNVCLFVNLPLGRWKRNGDSPVNRGLGWAFVRRPRVLRNHLLVTIFRFFVRCSIPCLLPTTSGLVSVVLLQRYRNMCLRPSIPGAQYRSLSDFILFYDPRTRASRIRYNTSTGNLRLGLSRRACSGYSLPAMLDGVVLLSPFSAILYGIFKPVHHHWVNAVSLSDDITSWLHMAPFPRVYIQKSSGCSSHSPYWTFAQK
jgi:hypothetical protein